MSSAAPNAPPNGLPRVIRFGPFELSMETGELRKYGVRVRLQHRPFQILAALVESPGRLVTREELRTRLWSSDVFVDFESGLNTAMNRLRIALGDSAENPQYVETLSRLGYRFLAPVQVDGEEPARTTIAPTIAVAQPPEVRQPKLEIASAPNPPQRARTLFSALAIAAILLAIAITAALKFNRHEIYFDRLTFRKGFVNTARFTKDGRILYSAEWNGSPSRFFVLNTERRGDKDLKH